MTHEYKLFKYQTYLKILSLLVNYVCGQNKGNV